MRYRGVAYYPEAWPASRWDEDIGLLREAGVNLVRMGEFAWSRIQPREDRFDLDWLVDVSGRLRRAGIAIVMGTPGAAPPAWLTASYPDVLLVGEDGRSRAHGGRRHTCPTSPTYRRLLCEAIRQVALALQGNRAVVAWQIDNEISGVCHCPACTAGFVRHLRERFGTLEALNAAWNNVFWSGDFSAWEQIRPPYRRVAWRLEYLRFQNRMWRGYVADQAAVLRDIRRDWRLTTNGCSRLTARTDTATLLAPLDFPSYDAYFGHHGSRDTYTAVFDFYRNIQQPPRPFWIAETNSWNSINTEAGRERALRPWAYAFLARGADAMTYFRWRQSVMGEENHPAVLDWSGRPGRTYQRVKAVYAELAELGEHIQDLPLPEASVGIVFSSDTAACAKLRKQPYLDHVVEADAICNRFHVLPDILRAGDVAAGRACLGRYPLVVLPGLEMVSAELAAALRQYVRDGGVLWAQPRLSTIDAHGKYLTEPMPAGLTDVFGLDVRQRWNIQDVPRHGEVAFRTVPGSQTPSVRVELSLGEAPLPVRGLDHMESIAPADDVSVLGRYASGAFAGEPAVTQRPSGRGVALYQACWLDEPGTRALFTYACEQARIVPGPATSDQIEIVRRGDLRFYLNHGPQPADVPQVAPGEPLVGRADGQSVSLAAFDVCVLREDPGRS